MITISFEENACHLAVEQLLIAEYGHGFGIPNELWAGIYFYCHFGFTPAKISQIIIRTKKLKELLEALALSRRSVNSDDEQTLRNLIVDQGKDVLLALKQVFPKEDIKLPKY